MFWDRFYALCIEKGIKPNPLGKQLGISSGIISHWKDGGMPNGDNVIKIADALDCSVDYLFERTDDPQAHKTQNTYTIQNRNTTVSGTQANVITAQPVDKETLELAQLIQSLPLVKRAEAVLAVEKIRQGL